MTSTVPKLSLFTGYSTTQPASRIAILGSDLPWTRQEYHNAGSTDEDVRRLRSENQRLTEQLRSMGRALAAVTPDNDRDLQASDLTREVVNAGFIRRIRSWPKHRASDLYATVVIDDDDLGE